MQVPTHHGCIVYDMADESIPGDTRSQFINSHGINLVSPDYLGFSTWWVKLVQLWLTHWGRVTHVCVSKLTIIGSDIGRRQAIIWTNAGILLIRTLWTNFSEILVEIHSFWFSKKTFENVVCEMASIWSRSQWVKRNFDEKVWVRKHWWESF